jgi:hypothetical protein
MRILFLYLLLLSSPPSQNLAYAEQFFYPSDVTGPFDFVVLDTVNVSWILKYGDYAGLCMLCTSSNKALTERTCPNEKNRSPHSFYFQQDGQKLIFTGQTYKQCFMDQ